MGVLRPLRVVIENYPEEVRGVRDRQQPRGPAAGTRRVPFSRVLYIERDDFMEDPPKKFFRLAPGREGAAARRLLHHLHRRREGRAAARSSSCAAPTIRRRAAATRPTGRKVKATLHWVSAAHALDAEVRLYDRLFKRETRTQDGDYRADLNPASLEVLDRLQGRAERRRRARRHALPVRAARLLLRRSRFDAGAAGVQPHRDAQGHLGEGKGGEGGGGGGGGEGRGGGGGGGGGGGEGRKNTAVEHQDG